MSNVLRIGAKPEKEPDAQSVTVSRCEAVTVSVNRGKLRIVIQTEIRDPDHWDNAKELMGLFTGQVDVIFQTHREQGDG